MILRWFCVAATSIVLAGVGAAQTTASPEVQFRSALQKEQVDQDLAAAAAQYRTLIAAHPRHETAARSWLQLAGILERQGDRIGAHAAYTRIIADFARLTELVQQADTRRGALDQSPIDRLVAWPTSFDQAADASVSLNGRYVSYVDMPTGDLHVRDLTTGQARRLTRIAENGGFTEYSAVSPDGRWFAFVAAEKGQINEGLRLLPMTATPATAARLLRPGYAAPKDWLPDSRSVLTLVSQIANRRATSRELAIVSRVDGSTRVLTTWLPPLMPSPDSIIKISPDGAYAASHVRASADDPQTDLFSVSLTDGKVEPLLPGPSRETFVGWTPDGRSIVFVSDREGTRDLWALPVERGRQAGNPVLLLKGFEGGPLGVSSSGRLYYERAYESRALFVAAVDVASGRLTEAPKAWSTNARARAPRWSRDGTSFAYFVDGQIAIRSVDTAITRMVPLRLGYKWSYDWSPSGETFVFRAAGIDGSVGIYEFNATTGDVQQLRRSEAGKVGYYHPQYDRAGDGLIYCREYFEQGNEPRQHAVVRWTRATGRETPMLVVDGAEDARYGCAVSPDGQSILTADGSASRLWVVDVATRKSREIFRASRPGAIAARDGVHWMPDSRAVIANVIGDKPGEPRSLWWIPIDSRPAHRIDIGLTTLVDDAFALHPSGGQVAFVAGDPVASKTGGPKRELRVLERLMPRSTVPKNP